jgi:Putative auto-transporter adhesin, head GIN domain
MLKILFLPFILLSLAGCSANGQFGKIEGSGKTIKETRNTGSFKGVQLSGSMEVILSRGPDFNVVVEADDNLLEYIDTKVKDDVLRIGTNTPNLKWVSTKNITVYVTLPELIIARVSGSGNLKTDDVFSTDGSFDAAVSGSGNCKLNIKTQKLEARVSGSGSITITGTADDTRIMLSGSGNYRGLNLETKDASVTISGSGGVETTVNGNLDARISGSGSVRYKGNASVNVRTSGSGRVSKI